MTMLHWSNDYAIGGMSEFSDTPIGRYTIIEDYRWQFQGGAYVEADSLIEAKAMCQQHFDVQMLDEHTSY